MVVFFFQAEDGIRYAQESRVLGDVYKRQDCADYADINLIIIKETLTDSTDNTDINL